MGKISAGDEVKTINPATGVIEFQPVTRKYGAEEKTYYRIKTDSEDLSCSVNHRFWVIGHGWIKAENLKIGEKIYSENGEQTIIQVKKINSAVPIIVRAGLKNLDSCISDKAALN